MSTILVAVGGNALVRGGQAGTIAEQRENAAVLSVALAELVAAGHRLVVTHGNGPQVGFIMLRSELVADSAPVPRLPLDLCVADSQGGVGYILTAALGSALARRGLADRCAYLLTHVVVDPADPAFAHPAKPIGPFFDAATAAEHQRRFGWTVVEDSGRGFRRVVPSPRPQRVVELAAIRALLDAGHVALAAGGGGIPVFEDAAGGLTGVEAVIDKDATSALLAAALGVDTLVLCTGVDRVQLRHGQPDAATLDRMTVAEAERHLAGGEFPEGSMGPKIRAALAFLGPGREVLIGSLERLGDALAGTSGTRIVP